MDHRSDIRTRSGASLQALTDRADHLHAVCKSDLREGDWVFVKTRNSCYRIRVLAGGRYSVSGGWFERKGSSPTTITISGCTWGGSIIKVDIIAACGLNMEFGNRLTTSTIEKIFFLPRQSMN
jgi:hypothetical protein